MYVRLLEELLALCTSSTFMDVQELLSPPVSHFTITGYKPLHTYEDSSSRKKTATGVGTGVGCGVGNAVGCSVGCAVGSSVGNAVGSAVGSSVGSSVGTAEGAQIEPELPTNIFVVETPLKSHQQIN